MNTDKDSTEIEACVYAVGETVFDIIFKDFQPMAAKPGGSAFNSMISLGRLGIPGSFISEVGADRVGEYIKGFLKENGVGNEYVSMYDEGKSALSLAFLNGNSDAEYDFYKDYPKQRLTSPIPQFRNIDYFLFGSFYGLNPVIRPQIQQLINHAEQASSLIYYDPNFRSSHLHELDILKPIIEENFRSASIVRASDEDLYNIYGIDCAEAAWKLMSEFCDYFIYTANAHGVDLFTKQFTLHVEVESISPVSTIGAGDTYNAGVLYGLYIRKISRDSLADLDKEEWIEILESAAMYSKEVCLSYDNYISKR